MYFGKQHGYNSAMAPGQQGSGCGDAPRPSCASVLEPYEAALLAGMVADPSAFDPVLHPQAATARRNTVLKDMLEEHYISPAQYLDGIKQSVPTATLIQQPQEPAAAPYFTSWLRPQILAAVGLNVRAGRQPGARIGGASDDRRIGRPNRYARRGAGEPRIAADRSEQVIGGLAR